MVDIHKCEQTYSCEVCGKKFFIKWRLEKHRSVHQENAKRCKYIQEGKICPFDKVGCKFAHKEERIANSQDEEIIQDNFCYFCETMFQSQDQLTEHMTFAHMDRFTN